MCVCVCVCGRRGEREIVSVKRIEQYSFRDVRTLALFSNLAG